jgi:tetratricopeptide (TPR) repeat protein
MPKPRHAIVGRVQLLAEVRERLLAGDDVALYAGLPGSGKTEMAAQLAWDKQLMEHFKDGVLWVGLGPNPSEDDLAYRLADWALAVGVAQERLRILPDSRAIASEMSGMIAGRELLLVIDDAWDDQSASIFKVGLPGSAHLLTTRLARVADDFAESEPVAVPELDDEAARALLAQYVPEVVQQRPEEIARCLQAAAGLPLALILVGLYLRDAAGGDRHELDMALAKVADARELYSEKLPPSVYQPLPEGVPPSLYAIIKLSDDQLSPETRDALRALAVFPPKVNTFSFEAGRAVSGSAEALHSLREYGLAEVIDPGNKRYTLHMAIWEYARETATDQSAYRRMAEYFIDYIQRQREAGCSKTVLFDDLEQEQANLAAALQWLVDSGKVQVGLRLASVLWDFWYERSRFAEGRSWIEKLLGLPGSDAPELVHERAEVLNDAGNFAYNQADLDTADKLHNESLRLRRWLGDEQAVAGSLNNLGLLYRERGDYDTAAAQFNEALEINRRLGNDRWAAINLNNLGVVAIRKGDGPTAQRFEEDSEKLFKILGDDWGCAMALSDLGAALLLQGQRTAAADRYRRSLRLQRQIKNPRGLAAALRGLAAIAAADDDRQRATLQFRAALGQSLDVGDQAGIADALEGLAAVEPGDEDGAARAAGFLAAADAFRSRSGFAVAPAAAPARDRELARVKATLEAERWQHTWEAGQTAPLKDVARQALGDRPPLIEDVVTLSLKEAPP